MVVLLEYFDSNFHNANFRNLSTLNTFVTVGLRIYDPLTETIADEQLFDQSYPSPALPANPLMLPRYLEARKSAINRAAENAGRLYAHKLSPTIIRIRREFYKKGKKSPEISIGTRYGDINEWEKAIETWKAGIDKTPKMKSRGRLAYNVAIGYEVLGDLEQALEWAGRSYTEYGNEMGDQYVRMLRRRISTESIVEEQMGN